MYSLFAKFIAKKYRPLVIAIAGTVGKTTTKRAIATVLSKVMTMRTSGLTGHDLFAARATILDGGVFRALRLLMKRDTTYPKALLLEYRATSERHMALCGGLVRPDIIVMTSLTPAHLDTLRSMEQLTRETVEFLACGRRDGWTVLAWDDARVQSLKHRIKGRVITYGAGEGADVRAIEIVVQQEVRDGTIVVNGTSFKLAYKGSAVPVYLHGVLGGPHVLGALAAAAVGILSDMNLVSISEALSAYEPVPGRMRLIPGIKRTLLIDDTYTASPASCSVGLQSLDALAIRPGGEKFAVLGDMVPLGDHTEQGHHDVGEQAAAIGIDYLITVGKLSRDIGRAAREKGMPEERIYHFTTPEEAGRFIQNRLEEGDCVYISGNELLRMEKIVKEIMAEPLKADGLLVRR